MPSHNPPSQKIKRVKGGIQLASRRLRDRSVAGPYHSQYTARRRFQSHSPSEEPAPQPVTSAYPEVLPRPPFSRIDMSAITYFAPELAGMTVGYIREALLSLGPGMLDVLPKVKTDLTGVSNAIPQTLPAVVNDVCGGMPTHILAVHGSSGPAKKHATLFPIHHIVVAAYCANVKLPVSNIDDSTSPGSTAHVPVVLLCVPAPGAFPQIMKFLYTKCIRNLISSMLPARPPALLYRGDPKSEVVLRMLYQFSNTLAMRYSAELLLAHLMMVIGTWHNVCSLGIDDEKLWCAIDVAWEIIRTAVAISTGKSP